MVATASMSNELFPARLKGMNVFPQKIVSGGQTGADRAALDFSIEHGISHGGWCPRGRKAEDGRIDGRYQLKETPSNSYILRTERNVHDSDGSVVFSIAAVLTGGSKRTVELARKHEKPCLHLSATSDGDKAAGLLREFTRQHGIKVLNVAGPRGSQAPGVAEFVTAALTKALRPDEAA
jgi:hypothetical protein